MSDRLTNLEKRTIRLKRDMEGGYVQINREATLHGGLRFPAGTVFRVSRRQPGNAVAVRSIPCRCCGVSSSMSVRGSWKRVMANDFSYLGHDMATGEAG